MDLQSGPHLVMGPSARDIVRTLLVAVLVPVVLFAVVLVLGPGPAAMGAAVVVIAMVTLAFWWASFTALTGPPPALTPEGIRLRPRPGRRASAVLPWSEVTSIGLLPIIRTRRTYLRVVAADAARYPGPRKDGVSFIYLSPTVVTPQQVRAAVQWFTRDRLVVHDEPPRRSLVGR